MAYKISMGWRGMGFIFAKKTSKQLMGKCMSEIISDDQVENLKADLFEARQALFSQDIEWRSAFEVSESEKINLNTQVTLLKGEINELKNSNEIIHCALLKHMDFIKILQCEYERVRSANNFMRSKISSALNCHPNAVAFLLEEALG